MLTEPSTQTVEPGRGGWLRARRHRLALWIAAGEGVIVAVSARPDEVDRRRARGPRHARLVPRPEQQLEHACGQVLWIFVVSQLLAAVLVLFAVFFKWLVILGLIAFAVIGLAILYFDRR